MPCAALQVQSKELATRAIEELAVHPFFAPLIACRGKEVYQKCLHFADKMKKCRGKQEMANTALEALHKSMIGQQVLVNKTVYM